MGSRLKLTIGFDSFWQVFRQRTFFVQVQAADNSFVAGIIQGIAVAGFSTNCFPKSIELQPVPMAAHPTNLLSRHTGDQCIVGNTFGDDGTRRDETISTQSNAANDRCICADSRSTTQQCCFIDSPSDDLTARIWYIGQLSRLVRGPLFLSLFKFVLVANFYFYQLKVGPDFILHPVSWIRRGRRCLPFSPRIHVCNFFSTYYYLSCSGWEKNKIYIRQLWVR